MDNNNVETYYKEALKTAQKDYRQRIAQGGSPVLPALDDFMPAEKTASGTSLGLVQVPLRLVTGTWTRGRVNAFAANFMPIMEDGTEFAYKWKALCRAHLSEGIREPVKLYEYMNRYYVVEGHKRVSVLKFFDSYSVAAYVTRILPEKTGDEAVRQYYEFVDFYKVSRVNYLEISEKGGYQTLLKYLGMADGEEWGEDFRRHFAAVYYRFEQAFNAAGGARLKTGAGDAFLDFIEIYGYPDLQGMASGEIRKRLEKMWEDVALKEQDDAIELKAEPAQEKKQTVLSKILPVGKPPVLKAAFIYDGTPERSGWNNDHEQGRRLAQEALEGRVETTAYRDALEEGADAVIQRAVAEGHTVIFTTSPRMLGASLRMAIERPDLTVMNCSLNISHRYVRTYYPRMYEVKFILGALAGSLTNSNRIGYVCDYPIFGQIAGINAFALGAGMVNPQARVYLEWSAVKGAKEAAEALSRQEIHIISSQDTVRFQEDDRKSFGLSHVGPDRTDLLAMPVWKWSVYYTEILRRILDKTIRTEYVNSSRALNYYWGMSAGVVDIEYAPALPANSRRFADFLRDGFVSGRNVPFLTPFNAQDGAVIGEGQKELTLEQIISMDYLAENVVGRIPSYDELTPMGRATVDAVGVGPAKEENA